MWKYVTVFIIFLMMLTAIPEYRAHQEEPSNPELTELQKLKIQNLTQRLELAQLRAQMAQRDFDAAREAITILLTSLKVEGYELNIETMSYSKPPVKEK